MAQRITNEMLATKFRYLTDIAAVRGVCVDGWRFGQNYGQCFNIVGQVGEKEWLSQVSNNWLTKREAWQGMDDMIRALSLVPRV